MSVDYSIRLTDPNNATLAILDGAEDIAWALKENDIGALTITVPNDYYPLGQFMIDGRLYVSRRQDAGPFALVGNTCWFIRRVEQMYMANGALVNQINAVGALELLARRIVAYASGSAYADKTATADDMIKAVVRENLGTLATDTARDISAWLSVAADIGAAASISKAFSRRNVLTVCQELVQASTTAGTWCGFDVVVTNEQTGTMQLRTYTGQRGVDRRRSSGNANAVLFGPDYGNFDTGRLNVDYTDERTYIYAGGQGEGAARVIGTASDTARIGISPFNRREHFRDARQSTTLVGVTDEADTELRARRPRTTLTGEIISGGTALYGVDFNFGDYITVEFNGQLYDCRISHVSARYERRTEQLTLKVQSDDT